MNATIATSTLSIFIEASNLSNFHAIGAKRKNVTILYTSLLYKSKVDKVVSRLKCLIWLDVNFLQPKLCIYKNGVRPTFLYDITP